MKQIYSFKPDRESHSQFRKFRVSKSNAILFLILGIITLSFQNSHAAIITVTNTNDAGAGSLRQAILDANNDAVLDIIEFDIGTGLQTIQPLTPLPIIDNDLIIDGTSQPGFVDIPIIEIDGSQQGAEIIIRIGGVVTGEVKGLIINGGQISAVAFANCTGGMVDNCFLGTDASGTVIDGNTFDGVSISNSNGIVIQNSVISGNGGDGIFLTNASTGITVKGCKIGTDITGTLDLGNINRGIFIQASDNNTVGGDDVADRNIISGNTRHGISITGNGNTVKGNFIGVDETGNNSLENGINGIIMQANNNIIGTPTAGNVISGNANRGVELGLTSTGNILQNNIIGLNAAGTAVISNITGVQVNTNTTNNTIGGDAINEGNTISGNDLSGIFLSGMGQKVEGNNIGTDITGNQDLGNGASGIRLNECNNCAVGGLDVGTRNIVSGNDAHGILIEDGLIGSNVDGNFIGTNSTGDAALPNTINGIQIDNADNNNIGVNSGNIISGNLETGVQMDNTSIGNVIIGNFIGTDITGLVAIPNDFGVAMTTNSVNNIVGGAGDFEGNLISGNLSSGISVGQNSDGTQILANQIGTDLNGTGPLPNGVAGILIDNSDNCIIGNGTENGQNLISGNTLAGIIIQDGSDGNEVMQNCIGTDIIGNADLGNSGTGIVIFDSANNIIGSVDGRNIISGNDGNGISVTGAASQNNVFQNNIIGLDINGLAALPNDEFGIVIFGSAGPNQIGGLGIDEGNVVSANLFSGIASGADNQIIEGNKIGTDINGAIDMGNDDSGIFLNGASNCTIDNNLISGNILSGCSIDNEAFGNQIRGNKIGTNEAGDDEIENGQSGIRFDNANNNTIGGSGIGESNLISGNATAGIAMFNSDGNKIFGNKIGTDLQGAGSIPNGDAVFLSTDSNDTEIGGTNAGEGNLLSGNNFDGVDINANCIGTFIKGNIIGLDIDGTTILPNGDNGVEIDDSPNCTIGGTTADERNVISGNEGIGIRINNAGLDEALIIGNFIGTNHDGTVALGNTEDGVEIDAESVVIGGGNLGEGNLISGNGGDGILHFGDNAIIQGNKLGTDVSGTFALPNEDSGIDSNGDNALIGGENLGEGNLTSGNEGEGIESFGDDATIKGNIIGMDVTGLDPIPNELSGISADGTNLQIGGQGVNDGNVISANLGSGIDLFDGDNVVIEGNIIGMDINGTSAAGNFDDGINDQTQGFVTIGGSVPAARNIISANGLNGISSFFAIDGEILGNLIGTDISGTQDFGNGAQGIFFFASLNYLIGGDIPGSSNTIAFNAMDGIGLSDDQFFFSGFECEIIQISENSIFNNGNKGINFQGNQTQVAIPVLTNVTPGATPNIQGTLTGNPNTDYTIEFFRNFNANASGNHEGEIFLGSEIITTDGAGEGIINATLNDVINATEVVTATAQEFDQNTSEFSDGVAAGALPIDLISIKAHSYEDYIRINWVTASELNNRGYYVERLSDQNEWESISFVNGKGTSHSETNYQFKDKDVLPNINYFYRLKQVDFDGRFEYTKVVSAKINGELSVGEFYPNPSSEFTSIKLFSNDLKDISIEIFDVLGQRIFTEIIEAEEQGSYRLQISDLRPGKFIARISIDNQTYIRKFIKLE